MSSFRQQSRADSENEYSALYDGSGTTAGSLMPGGKTVKEKSPWETVNTVMMVVLIMGGFGYIYAFGLTVVCGFAVLIGSILLAILYRIWKKHGRGRVLLTVLRPLVIAATAGLLLSPWALIFGEKAKWMYPVKRFAYAYGVGDAEYCETVLPAWLPEQCTDYKYRTQGQAPAQDYRPAMFLRFRTDAETMHQYAERFRALGMAQVELTPVETDENGEPYLEGGKYLAPREIPGYALSHFDVTDDLRQAEVYYDDRSRGAALNYETGLVLFWTD